MIEGSVVGALSVAARAYRSSNAVGPIGAAGPGEPPPAARPNFEDFVVGSMKDAVGTLREADRTAVAGVAGKASTQKVVEAVLAADATLQTVVAVRDRLVQAYQELIRMPL